MGLKVFKFHSFLHVAQDILNFGVPMEVNTGANESGHKAEKKVAKLTQNNRSKFDLQSGIRMMEMFLLEIAEEEMKDNCLWEYYYAEEEDDESNDEEQEDTKLLGGGCIVAIFDPIEQKYCPGTNSAAQDPQKKIKLEQALVDYLAKIHSFLSPYI